MCGLIVGQSATGPSPNLDFLSFGPITSSEGRLWDMESMVRVQCTQFTINNMKQLNYQSIGMNLYQHHSIAYLITNFKIQPEEFFKIIMPY